MARTGAAPARTEAARVIGSHDAHFAEERASGQPGQRDGVRGLGVFDDLDIALDDDEEGVALAAFADNPFARGEVADVSLLREECLRGEAGAGEHGYGRDGVEERWSRDNHPWFSG